MFSRLNPVLLRGDQPGGGSRFSPLRQYRGALRNCFMFAFSAWLRKSFPRLIGTSKRMARKKNGLSLRLEWLEERVVPAISLLVPSQVTNAYGLNALVYGGGTGSGATVNITSLSGTGLAGVSLNAAGT